MPVSSQHFGNETFNASKGHVRESHGGTSHEAGLGIQMEDDFVVSLISPDGQTYGKVKVGDKLVGVDGLTLPEAGISTVDAFKAYMVGNHGEAALHFNLMPKEPQKKSPPPKPTPEKQACNPLIPIMAVVAVVCLICGAALPWMAADININIGMSAKSENGLYRICEESSLSSRTCYRVQVKDMNDRQAFAAIIIPFVAGLFSLTALLFVMGKLASHAKVLGGLSVLLGLLAVAGTAVYFDDVKKIVDDNDVADYEAGGPLALIGAVGVFLTGVVMIMKSGPNKASSAPTVSLGDVENQLDNVKK